MSKILLFDLETTPNLGYIWGKYEQDVLEFTRDWYILTFAYKWLGEKTTHAYALTDFKTYKKEPENDRELVQKLWTLFDEADIIIAHNGDEFDIKKAQAKFVQHQLPPPTPFKTIDTKKIAKRYFKFDSNKLDDLGGYLNLGHKIQTGGFELWKGCMKGEKKAWKKMVRYNKQDVVLLEKVYLTLRPWTDNHPNLNLLNETQGCPVCGGTHLQRRGYRLTRSSKFIRYQCQDCGAWSSGAGEKLKELVIR
jgi:hypothetical protein